MKAMHLLCYHDDDEVEAGVVQINKAWALRVGPVTVLNLSDEDLRVVAAAVELVLTGHDQPDQEDIEAMARRQADMAREDAKYMGVPASMGGNPDDRPEAGR